MIVCVCLGVRLWFWHCFFSGFKLRAAAMGAVAGVRFCPTVVDRVSEEFQSSKMRIPLLCSFFTFRPAAIRQYMQTKHAANLPMLGLRQKDLPRICVHQDGKYQEGTYPGWFWEAMSENGQTWVEKRCSRI